MQNVNRRTKAIFNFARICLFLGSPIFVSSLIGPSNAFAQDPVNSPTTTPPSAQSDSGEQVNVDAIKEKYWARGQETELGVVQNRSFSKKGKVEVSFMTSVLYSDPFLDVKTFGTSIGYHFNEYLALSLVYFKDIVNPSSALTTFQQQLGATTNTNMPKYYVGLETTASIFYGKLSVLGKSIIYYDFHLLGGLGATNTESGTYFTPTVGLGQRFYLSKLVSLRLDYRLQYYRETILEKQVTTLLGQPQGQRDNWSNVITLGVNFMFFGK